MEIDFNDFPEFVQEFGRWRCLVLEEIRARFKNDRSRKAVKARDSRLDMEAWWSGDPGWGIETQTYFLADALNDVFSGTSAWVVFEKAPRKDGDEAVWVLEPDCGFTIQEAKAVMNKLWRLVEKRFNGYRLLFQRDFTSHRTRPACRVLLIRKEDYDEKKYKGWETIGGTK